MSWKNQSTLSTAGKHHCDIRTWLAHGQQRISQWPSGTAASQCRAEAPRPRSWTCCCWAKSPRAPPWSRLTNSSHPWQFWKLIMTELPFGIKTSRQERTSFAQIYYSSSTDLIPPAGLKPTLKPVTSWYSLMARHMTSPTARVALTPSLPVLVLMKSEPAIMQTREHWAEIICRHRTKIMQRSYFVHVVHGSKLSYGQNWLHVGGATCSLHRNNLAENGVNDSFELTLTISKLSCPCFKVNYHSALS